MGSRRRSRNRRSEVLLEVKRDRGMERGGRDGGSVYEGEGRRTVAESGGRRG